MSQRVHQKGVSSLPGQVELLTAINSTALTGNIGVGCISYSRVACVFFLRIDSCDQGQFGECFFVSGIS